MIHYPAVRFLFVLFCFLSFVFFLVEVGVLNGKEADERGGDLGPQLIGSWSLWQIRSKTCVKKLSDLAKDLRTEALSLSQTHTQIGVDIHLWAVTFYLSILFIIVQQYKRQTGKGYDVTHRGFVATKWLGNTSTGGHFSCGVCLHLVFVLDTPVDEDCNKFGPGAELVLKFTHRDTRAEKNTHTPTSHICHRQCVGVRAEVIDS